MQKCDSEALKVQTSNRMPAQEETSMEGHNTIAKFQNYIVKTRNGIIVDIVNEW